MSNLQGLVIRLFPGSGFSAIPMQLLISRVLKNTGDLNLVAGWACPYGYTKKQQEQQLKEDYVKNYLVVMESLLLIQ